MSNIASPRSNRHSGFYRDEVNNRLDIYHEGEKVASYSGDRGAVTQATSRSTGVTVNALSGTITGDGTSLAAEATATFTVTNDRVAIGDVVAISVRSGPTSGATSFRVTAVAAGSFDISATNNNVAAGTADTGAPVINFVVLKCPVA